MILVADSGSTKCDWILLKSDGEQIPTHTMGFNPFFHSSDLVEEKLNENEVMKTWAAQVEAVYFYGAGCSSEDRNNIIKAGLQRVFINASEILVDHDLTGAALATCYDKPGISCIIGTGSNSCYFDGTEVHEEVPALGYILGDEGSGAYFGKLTLANFLYHRLPAELTEALIAKHNLTKEDIFHYTYNHENPNVYLASFMKTIADFKSHPYVHDMIYNGLEKFADVHIKCYSNYQEVPVHFVGSIAFHFKEILEEVASKNNFKIGLIEKKPVTAILNYHKTQSPVKLNH